MLHDLERMKNLLEYCTQMKFYYRSIHHDIAEKLFAYLEFKVGIMYEMSVFYACNDVIENRPVVQSYQDNQEFPVYAMKIYEVQNLVLTHFISIIESSLRSLLFVNGYTNKKMVMGEILDALLTENLISKQEFYLWSGVRHIRNAIVHYDKHAHVSQTYRFTGELVIKLKDSKALTSNDTFEYVKLMEWMAYSVRRVFH